MSYRCLKSLNLHTNNHSCSFGCYNDFVVCVVVDAVVGIHALPVVGIREQPVVVGIPFVDSCCFDIAVGVLPVVDSCGARVVDIPVVVDNIRLDKRYYFPLHNSNRQRLPLPAKPRWRKVQK